MLLITFCVSYWVDAREARPIFLFSMNNKAQTHKSFGVFNFYPLVTRLYCQWFLILYLFGGVYILFDCCVFRVWCSWSKSNQNSNISLFSKVCLQWSCEIIYNFHIGYDFIWAFINAHCLPMTESSFYSKCQPAGVLFINFIQCFLTLSKKFLFVNYTI